jgi:hypothetical protein
VKLALPHILPILFCIFEEWNSDFYTKLFFQFLYEFNVNNEIHNEWKNGRHIPQILHHASLGCHLVWEEASRVGFCYSVMLWLVSLASWMPLVIVRSQKIDRTRRNLIDVLWSRVSEKNIKGLGQSEPFFPGDPPSMVIPSLWPQLCLGLELDCLLTMVILSLWPQLCLGLELGCSLPLLEWHGFRSLGTQVGPYTCLIVIWLKLRTRVSGYASQYCG